MNTTEQKSDNSLMLEAQNGNTEAIGDLYDRHQKNLYGFFVRLTGKKNCSCDLTQNVFLRILRFKHTYNPAHQFRTWMYQIARNVLADHYNSKNSLIKYSNNSDNDFNNESEQQSGYSSREDLVLYRAIGQLSAEQQQLIELSKFQKLKYEEIAVITNDTVGNIKVKVHRAIITLKDIYFKVDSTIDFQ